MVLISQWLSAAVLSAVGMATTDGESILTSEIGRQNNQSLFWGPYKPNLYFGVRPRAAEGLWTGLMWSNVDTFMSVRDGFRYTCEQGEDIHGYGWDEYDARHGGVQTIRDKGNKVDLTTTFVKVPGGGHGGSWAARISGKLRPDAEKNAKTMLFYYIAQEGDGSLEVDGQGTEFGFEGDVTLNGESKTLGQYSIVVTKGEGKTPDSTHELGKLRKCDTTLVKSVSFPDEVLWQGKHAVYQYLGEATTFVQENYNLTENPPEAWVVYRLNHGPGAGKAHIVQKTFEGDFEFDVILSSGSAGEPLDSERVTKEIKRTSELFGERFTKIFNLQAPFKADKYLKFGKSMFSNLLGGVGYFQGEQLIDRSYAEEYDEENEGFWDETAAARARGAQKLEGPYELYTSIPSRPFFPRGFLWDEGFHLIPISDWDMDLTLDIIKSWYHTMDEDGWIPREQILGAEARSKVPEEFQVQYPHYANPPTLFLVIESFMERLRALNGTAPAEKETLSQDQKLYTAHLENAELGEAYLRKVYPLLMRQYQWFRRTQKGDIKTYDREAFSTREAYRWRGRSETHCLTSGLDDYPRASPPHPGELHVDLMSWVGLMSKSLMNIADALGIDEDVIELRKNLVAIENNLNDLHWSEENGCYCDATIDDYEEHKLVCHKGYVSLFPFLLGLMKHDDPKVGKILSLLGDENELFSPFGIRSLSKQDEFYGTAENYWRSPVWMPMNYMALRQLYNIAIQSGPHRKTARDLYTRLRKNLVDTVYKSWEETGFAWEQYHPETGAGKGVQHFTGWTSLVVKIMAMENLGEESGHDEL